MKNVERFKTVLGYVTRYGAGILSGAAARALVGDDARIDVKVSAAVAGIGLGMAMGEAAEKAMNKTIDDVVVAFL